MRNLAHTELLTLTLTVDFAAIATIGATPAGQRRIAPVTGGVFVGPRLRGTVLPGGQDWVINRADGVMVIDVRLTLSTDDGVLIYLSYRGRMVAAPEAMARMAKGHVLDPSEYSLVIVARCESGHERYRWLNDVIAVGTGEQTATGPIYSLYAIGNEIVAGAAKIAP